MKNIEKLTAHEKRQLEEELRQANSTIANLIRSFLIVIDETEGSSTKKEQLKASFLFNVGGILDARISSGLVRELEMVVENLREEKNPVASTVEALAVAIQARIKKR